LALGPDGNEELVETHGGVNGHLPSKVVLDLVLLYRIWRVVSNHSRKSVNSHCSDWEKEGVGGKQEKQEKPDIIKNFFG